MPIFKVLNTVMLSFKVMLDARFGSTYTKIGTIK